MAAERRNWTREELLVALGLYMRLPYSRFNQRTPDFIECAARLCRSPSAVAMKLSNFASIDDSLNQQGLPNVSRADRDLWKEIETNWPAIASEIYDARERYNFQTPNQSSRAEGERSNWTGEDVTTEVRVRRGQALFRESVLAAYGGRCCITGLDDPLLLNASHIVPWRDDPDNRLNPRNGLCLSALHDRAFDRGLIALDRNLRLVLSDQLQSIDSPFVHSCFGDYAGKTISLPTRFGPRIEFVDYHRDHIFLG